MTQAVAQKMVDAKIKGNIVNIGSMWAKQAIKATPSSAYSMAKAGLHSLTQHRAMELADHGKGTTTCCRRPGGRNHFFPLRRETRILRQARAPATVLVARPCG